jgi:alpha-N-arabinofuranosidase
MVGKNIFLSIDEYAYFGGGFGRPTTLKQSLAYGMIFNEMLRHTDILTMAAHTTGVSTIDFNRTSATMNTLGLTFKLYANQFVGAIPVALSGNSPQPAPRFPPGGDQPKTSSGSPTYPLDMFAALSPDKKFLILSVVNATESEQKFDLNVSGTRIAGPSTLWQLTGNTLDATDRVGQPPQVEIREISIANAPETISVAPISVNIYRFPVALAAQ